MIVNDKLLIPLWFGYGALVIIPLALLFKLQKLDEEEDKNNEDEE